MKEKGAQTGQPGGARSRSTPPDRPPRSAAARFAAAARRPARAVRVPAALALALALSRRVAEKHGASSVADTRRFIDSVFRGPRGEELPGPGAGLVFVEPGGASLRSFNTWLLTSVLSLTVTKLEQNFLTWTNQIYVTQAHANLRHESYLKLNSDRRHRSSTERLSNLERRLDAEGRDYRGLRSQLEQSYAAFALSHHYREMFAAAHLVSSPSPTTPRTARQDAGLLTLEHTDLRGNFSRLERLSYLGGGTHLPARDAAREATREAFLRQLASRVGAWAERGPTSRVLTESLRGAYAEGVGHNYGEGGHSYDEGVGRAYAGYAGWSYTKVLQQPSAQAARLWLQTYLISTLRAFESRAHAGTRTAESVRAPSPHAAAATGARAAAPGRAGDGVRESATPVFDAAAPPSLVFVSPGDAPREAYARGTDGPARAGIGELTALLSSARVMAEEVRRAYETFVAGTLGGARGVYAGRPQVVSASASREASAAHADADGDSAGVGRAGFAAGLSLTSTFASRLSAATSTAAARRGDGFGFSNRTFVPSRAVGRGERGRASGLASGRGEARHAGTAAGALLKAARADSPARPGRESARPGGELTHSSSDVLARMPNPALAAAAMLTAGLSPHRPEAERRPDAAPGALTFLRRDEEMRPPKQTYAFAQPLRPAPLEERVVKHVWEKEVVEIVKKEVATAAKSVQQPRGLTRADYSRIADHVYSSLTRRLMLEKERTVFAR